MKSSEFKSLLLPFSSRLFRLSYSLLNNREEAEDVVQEVYLKLWKMRQDLGKYDSLEGLSVRITRNLCLDYLRRREKARAYTENEQSVSKINGNDPSDEIIVKERSVLINKLINQLPEPQRSLVYFRHIEEKEYSEIEKLMDMKENAIRVSISRARKQLKEMLQKHYTSWTI
jgi:RNA polymerase sigma-70 factor (ECF subfamily)